MIGSQSGEQRVNEYAQLSLLRIYCIVIRSELKYLIEAKVLSWRNCENGQNTAGSVRDDLLIMCNRLQLFKVGSNPDPEPNR